MSVVTLYYSGHGSPPGSAQLPAPVPGVSVASVAALLQANSFMTTFAAVLAILGL